MVLGGKRETNSRSTAYQNSANITLEQNLSQSLCQRKMLLCNIVVVRLCPGSLQRAQAVFYPTMFPTTRYRSVLLTVMLSKPRLEFLVFSIFLASCPSCGSSGAACGYDNESFDLIWLACYLCQCMPTIKRRGLAARLSRACGGGGTCACPATGVSHLAKLLVVRWT